MTTISYADVGRGPDTVGAGRRGARGRPPGRAPREPHRAPRTAIHGVTLDSAVAYDRDKLAAAVETLAATIDQTPADASVSAGQGGTFSVTAGEGRSRRGQGGPADRARPAARGARHAGVDRDGRAGRVVGTRRRHRLGRGGDGGRGSDGRRRGRRPGQGHAGRSPATSLAPLITFPTAADGSITPVFDRVGPRPDRSRRWPRRSTRPRRTRASSWSADTSSPPAPAARAERSTLPA